MSKITTLEEFRLLRERLRMAGQTLVLTNGHFDVLHVGHVRYLQAAKVLGDVLVVGLNDDASTRALKGPQRPIVPASERTELLAALEAVDYVIPFAELTAEQLVTTLQPEIYVKGADWDVDHLPEAPAVQAYGGQIRLIDVVPGESTTNIIAVILERYGEC
ncbi:MAG: D-glycero-beta-D-manno-heptose 1-phosphate adenylyltransferase [Anaerolineae bacterium]